MFEQPAPRSEEAEAAVLGAIIVNPDAFLTIASFLKHDDFHNVRHSQIWQALNRLHDRREAIDYLTVVQELKDLKWLENVGGAAYITSLMTAAPSSAHAEVYGRMVEQSAVRRKMLLAADEIKSLAYDESLSIDTLTSEAENKLFGVTDAQVQRDFIPMNDAIDEYFDRIDHLMNSSDQDGLGIPTGFNDLDTLLGGLQRSDLLIFAGRPGMGKTSWLLSAAVNVARRGKHVGIFTMEMGHEQLTQRIIAMETGISSQALRRGNLTSREYARFVEAAGRVSNFPIFIDDTPALSPVQMRTKCRRLYHEQGIDVIILDYMQLMNAGGMYQNNRVQEMSYISRYLKELARELNVPLLSAAQLSRAVEQRQEKRPVLSDLRESGCLAGDSPVYLPDEGRHVPIRDLVGKTDFRVLSLNTETWKLEPGTVTNAFCTGTKPVYKMTTRLGRSIRATGNHKFLTRDGWKRLDELTVDTYIAVPGETHTSVTGETSNKDNAFATMIAGLTGNDTMWDPIVSIEPDGESDVYDLTINIYQNFLSCNIFCHNSIEQDADIVMFLYRDVVYNQATEHPNSAEIIVAKHRNGPTGTIQLYFDNKITKFMDGVVRNVDMGDEG